MRKLLVLGIINVLVSLGTGLVGPMLSLYYNQITEDVKSVGILYGTFWFLVASIELFLRNYIEKIGYKKVLAFGLLLSAIADLLYVFSFTFELLLITEIIAAIANAFLFIGTYSIASSLSKERGKNIATIDALANFSYAFAALFSGFLIAAFNYEFLFLFSGSLNLLSLFLLTFI